MSTKRSHCYCSLALVAICCGLLLAPFASGERPKISDDRDLKPIDLTGWDCRDRLQGAATSTDATARNRQKNRPAADLTAFHQEPLDSAGFLRQVAEFDSRTRGKHRSDLSPAETAELKQLENQVVSLTGYLVFFYAGPPESTNCGSTDFHDWHLEIFAAPSDHPPRVGDPTPIIVEITPRTLNAIYASAIRLQSLAAFFRSPDLSYQSTGHPARKIRVTGNLLWDDEHNRATEVGPAVTSAPPKQYHRPWRATAWEIHPIARIEIADAPAP